MRAAGENDALGAEPTDPLGIGIEGNDLAIDTRFAHPPGNQLGDLGAEIENENAVCHILSIISGADIAAPAGSSCVLKAITVGNQCVEVGPAISDIRLAFIHALGDDLTPQAIVKT